MKGSAIPDQILQQLPDAIGVQNDRSSSKRQTLGMVRPWFLGPLPADARERHHLCQPGALFCILASPRIRPSQ